MDDQEKSKQWLIEELSELRQRVASKLCCGGMFLVACIVMLSPGVEAGDWPQILGPNRNGVALEEHIADSFPATGIRTMWQRDVGKGFAGVAVSKGIAVLYHRVADQEVVEALAASTGKLLWKSTFSATYVPILSDDDGPRVVPIIAQNRVYTYGAMGHLRCHDLTTGKTLWERDTYQDYNSKEPVEGEPPEGYFGIGSSPIVESDKIIVNIGGDTQEAGIVAFSLDTGRTVWKATAERASYSSPVAVSIAGVRHVIFVTRLNVISLDPGNGKVRFQFPFGRRGPTVNAASPVLFDGHLFVTASYGIGSVLAKIDGERAEVLWRDPGILASQYTTCVESGGYLFGIHGRQDGPRAELRCFDPRTRKMLWAEPSFGYATLIRADDKLLILKTDGTLVLAAANASKYEELSRTQVCEHTTRALPALAEGLLYVRDTSVLKCLDLRPNKQ
jgi:outer membrane protein assembly factor BamB